MAKDNKQSKDEIRESEVIRKAVAEMPMKIKKMLKAKGYPRFKGFKV